MQVQYLARTAYPGHAWIQREGKGVRNPPPLPSPRNHKNIGFLSNTGLDPLKNHKATKQAFNVGSSSARQRNTFRWWDDDDSLKVVFGSYIPSSTNKKKIKKIKKTLVKVGPAHAGDHYVLPRYWVRYSFICRQEALKHVPS